jgi:hypothetical protein
LIGDGGAASFKLNALSLSRGKILNEVRSIRFVSFW